MKRKRKHKKHNEVPKKRKKQEFEFDFIANILSELKDLITYYNIYYDKLSNKFNKDSCDKLINDIIQKTHQLKKYIVNIFWKETPYFYQMSKLKIKQLVTKTIVYLHQNIDGIIEDNPNLFYFYWPICLVVNKNENNNNFYEESILIKTSNIVNILSNKYYMNNCINKKKGYYKDTMQMTFNLLNKLQKTKNLDHICFRTTKRTVKQNMSKFYFNEKNNIF